MRVLQDIKGVIFDVDGVLLDSLGIWKDLGVGYLVSIGKTPEKGLIDTLFSMSMEEGAEYLRVHYSLAETAESIRESLQDMLRVFYYDEVMAKPGAQRLLRVIDGAGIRITAATSSPRHLIEKALERNGLLGYM